MTIMVSVMRRKLRELLLQEIHGLARRWSVENIALLVALGVTVSLCAGLPEPLAGCLRIGGTEFEPNAD
jgi:hypothetical protein